jgi:hypothetical protein
VGTSCEAAAREDDDEDEDGTLQGGGLVLLEEETGGLDAATRSGGLRLGLLDDGLEPSTEGSSLGVVWHGDRTGQRTRGRMNNANSEMNSAT